jgi:transposase-like protein
MTAKGRQATGENHGEAKLTEDAVRLIRSSGETLSILAARYGVDRSLIHQVRHHQIWRHVR